MTSREAFVNAAGNMEIRICVVADAAQRQHMREELCAMAVAFHKATCCTSGVKCANCIKLLNECGLEKETP